MTIIIYYYDHNAIGFTILWPGVPEEASLARYGKGQREATRRHILEIASAQFRESGIAAVGLAGIMTDAGLTNGAFYTHFASKEELVRAVLRDALERREQRLRDNLAVGVALETTIRDYLSPRHRDGAASGCPTAALAAEIARHPKATRDAFTAKIKDIIALMAAQMPEGSPKERRRRAVAVYAIMVGALQLARAINDRQLSEDILADAAEAAIGLANGR
jgi:AcrR family transcriptional regulator